MAWITEKADPPLYRTGADLLIGHMDSIAHYRQNIEISKLNGACFFADNGNYTQPVNQAYHSSRSSAHAVRIFLSSKGWMELLSSLCSDRLSAGVFPSPSTDIQAPERTPAAYTPVRLGLIGMPLPGGTSFLGRFSEYPLP